MAAKQLLDNDRWIITLDPTKSLVRSIRKNTQTRSGPELERQYDELVAVFDALPRARHMLLADLRGSPLRNDPEFEQILGRLRPKFFAGFARVAVLVKTAVGALQVKRYAREDGIDVHVYDNEEDALAFLEGRRSPSRP